ncbi:MAG: alpha/beta hydrolase [Planctomycetota bacterium]
MTYHEEYVELSSSPDPLRTRWLTYQNGERTSATILGLHMLGLGAESFSGIAESLAAFGLDYKLHCYDQRGNASAAIQPPQSFRQWVEDALSALDRISDERVHLVGASLGGSVAASLAAEIQENRIASLTLIATPAAAQPAFTDRACAEREGTLDRIEKETIKRWFGDAGNSTVVEMARQSIRRMTARGHDSAWRAFAQFDGYAKIARRLPATLCIAFADDVSTPPGEMDLIAEQLHAAGRAVRRVDISGAGHVGMLCKPAEVAALVIDHIRTNP